MARGAIRRGNLTLYPNWQLGADLRRTGALDPELQRLASEAALGAKEIAVKVAFDTGAYFSSIHAELGHNRRGLRVGLVVADDFKANWIEKGYRTIRGQGSRSGERGRRTRIQNLESGAELGFVKGKNVLRRGARKTGLRVRAPRKRG